MARRHRLDAELVDQGLFLTADEAMRAVMAGEVSTDGRRLTSPGEQVLPGIPLHVKGKDSYVSRGGLKLERGIEAFGVDAEGLACLDVGCSTGGFTDCLLRHGAASVLAVDVGVAQFDWSLRQDPRVELLERTNIRDIPLDGRAASIDLAVCDVSFTSVLAVAGTVLELLRHGGRFLTLVKPQFEVARDDVGAGGVVRDPSLRLDALRAVAQGLQEAGFGLLGACESPITGAKGNHEYLLLCEKGASAGSLDLEAVVMRGEVAVNGATRTGGTLDTSV